MMPIILSTSRHESTTATPVQLPYRLGLIGARATTHGNGVAAMVERIQAMARGQGEDV